MSLRLWIESEDKDEGWILDRLERFNRFRE